MILALAVALAMGVAIGWLIHSTSHRKHTQALTTHLVRQQAQVKQANSDIAMLNDDYDELHRNSTERINALRDENRQIPALQSNLEKSQLLVRQMMQRHDTKIRELTSENEDLSSRLRQLNLSQASSLQDSHPQGKRGMYAEHDLTEQDERPPSDAEQRRGDTKSQDVSKKSASIVQFAAVESDDDPFDAVIEIDSDLQLELDQTSGRSLEHTSDRTQTQQTLKYELLPEEPSEVLPADNKPDDLQQIFGIGPLTEKALNELGITQYSQLAELERHDIERIAQALDIGPARIERDDWVGNARRQLEDVLDQL